MATVLQRRPPGPREHSHSALTVRNIVVGGHRTSVRLEPVMWEALRDIARAEQVGINDLVTAIDGRRNGLSLTAAIRVHIVDFYRSATRRRAEPEEVAALSV